MGLLMLGFQNHPKYTAFTNISISYIEWIIGKHEYHGHHHTINMAIKWQYFWQTPTVVE